MQHAQSRLSDGGDPLKFPNRCWYARFHGVSHYSAFEKARLELARFEGYHADVQDTDFTDWEQASVSESEDSTAASSSVTTWSDSEDESQFVASKIDEITRRHHDDIAVLKRAVNLSARNAPHAMTSDSNEFSVTTWSDSEDESEPITSKIDNITRQHHEEMAVLDKRTVNFLAENSPHNMPSTNTVTTTTEFEHVPITRVWTKEMDHRHARERQIAWTGAAWAYAYKDDTEVGYEALKGQLQLLRRRQNKAREALVDLVDEWYAYDEAGLHLQC